MKTETCHPSRIIALGEDAPPQERLAAALAAHSVPRAVRVFAHGPHSAWTAPRSHSRRTGLTDWRCHLVGCRPIRLLEAH
ncbi:hypothetical protein [Streptomyces sp. uw30]|uniref:hypothetical protein n=1 Tax=Streptomyces sp. uw30 TaxID=1828179 RepID=UPI00165117A2|nr:hypothetical protein [Streptomyces sp. uw30]